MQLSVDVYHDARLNETLPADLNYRIWLYSNSSGDWKLDDLINETTNVPEEQYYLRGTYSLTSTEDFDNGTKSDMGDHYAIESYSDNPFYENNSFGLGNKLGDTFLRDDADALNWKWENDTGFAGMPNDESHTKVNISNGSMQFTTDDQGIWTWTQRTMNTTLTGAFETRITMNHSGDGSDSEDSLFAVQTDGGTGTDYAYFENYWGGSDYRLSVEAQNSETGSILSGVVSLGADPNITYVIKRNAAGEILMGYEQYGTFTDMTGWTYWNESDAQVLAATDDSAPATNLTTYWTNFNTTGESGGNGFETSGNWTSASIAMSNATLKNATITYKSASDSDCVSKIQWLVASAVEAEYNSSLCKTDYYQENATEKSELGFGWAYEENVTDGDWDTYGYAESFGGVTATSYMNYSIPAGATNDSVWQVKDIAGTQNLTTPAECWWGDKLEFAVTSERKYVSKKYYYYRNWYCLDENEAEAWLAGGGETTAINNSYVYEEAMWWSIDKTAVIKEENLTSGSFNDVNETFQVRLFLEGDGTSSPLVKSVDNYYSENATRQKFASIATSSCIVSGYWDTYAPRKIVAGVWSK
jgi:hypothetical protein